MPLQTFFWTVNPAGNLQLYSAYPGGNPPEPVWTQVPNYLNQTASLSVDIATSYMTPTSGVTLVLNGTLPAGWAFTSNLLTYDGVTVNTSPTTGLFFTALYAGIYVNSNTFSVQGLTGAVSPDVTPPTVPLGVNANSISQTSANIGGYPSVDPNPPNSAWDGMKQYNVTVTGAPGSPFTVPSAVGNQPIFLLQTIGTQTPGTLTQTGPDLTLTSYGTSLYGSADACDGAFQQLTASSGILLCKISSWVATSEYATAALQIRNGLTAGAQNVAMVCFPFSQGVGFSFQNRATANGATSGNGADTANSTSPIWMAIVFNAGTYAAYYSTNGNTFTQQGTTVTQAMAGTLYFGVVLSNNDGTAGTQVSCTFQQVDLQTSGNWSLSLSGLSPGVTYPVSVTAQDVAGNISSSSASISFTTLSTADNLAIVTTALPGATEGTAYSFQCTSSGGNTPQTWSATGLPAGLLMAGPTGFITGTPTAGGAFSVVVKVTDGTVSPTKTFPLTVSITALTITSANPLPQGTVNTAYSYTLTASGGVPPYTWTPPAGGDPGWLALNESTGVLSGTPPASASYSLDFTVTDSNTPTADTASETFTLAVSTSAPVTGPASDLFPRTHVNFISGPYIGTIVSGNTLAGLSFAALAEQSNIVEINPYTGGSAGTNGFEGQYVTVASLMSKWKADAAAIGNKLWCINYNDGWANQYGAPGDSTLHPWLVAAFKTASMWAYTSASASGNTDTTGYAYSGNSGQSSLNITSPTYNPHQPTLPGFTFTGIGGEPNAVNALEGLNIWQVYARYFYDIWVKGLCGSKYGTAGGYAVNPYIDGHYLDNTTPSVATSGAANTVATWFGTGTTPVGVTAQTSAGVQQGCAIWASTIRSTWTAGGNASPIVMFNAGLADFLVSGTSQGNFGSLDSTYQNCASYFEEACIGDGIEKSHNSPPGYWLWNGCAKAAALVAPGGTYVLHMSGMPNGAGNGELASNQSSWSTGTGSPWQALRFGFAAAMMINSHFCWNGGLQNYGSVGMLDEQCQTISGNAVVGWLSAGSQRTDPPQSAGGGQGGFLTGTVSGGLLSQVGCRRYPNGWVLWNPYGNGIATINVPTTLYRIGPNPAGRFGDPAVNSGAQVSSGQVTLQSADGLFLIGTG